MPIEDSIRSGGHAAVSKGQSALDLLEREDIELRRLFSAVETADSETVEGRAAYGDAAKEIVQHLATREAALAEVARKVATIPNVGSGSKSFDGDSTARRELLDRLEKMSRGIQGMSLNTGQDFDGVLRQVIDAVRPEIDRDLAESIPAVHTWLMTSGDPDTFKSADYITRHAPTSLNPRGPRWYERAPIISRILTIYDRLRDFPAASKHH